MQHLYSPWAPVGGSRAAPACVGRDIHPLVCSRLRCHECRIHEASIQPASPFGPAPCAVHDLPTCTPPPCPNWNQLLKSGRKWEDCQEIPAGCACPPVTSGPPVSSSAVCLGSWKPVEPFKRLLMILINLSKMDYPVCLPA